MKELKIQATSVFQKNYQATKRFVVNIGGSRSTKTYSILQLLIVKALSSDEPLLISIVRKSFPSLRISVMRDFFQILKELDLYEDERYNATEKSYMLGNSTIEFFSIDDAQKRRGTKRNILYINEANELSWEDFFQLQIRTTDQIFMDFNPSEFFWYNEQLEPREDIEVIRRRRLEAMKNAQAQKAEWAQNGHGKYSEIADEREFFDTCKKILTDDGIFVLHTITKPTKSTYLTGQQKYSINVWTDKYIFPGAKTKIKQANKWKCHFAFGNINAMNIRLQIT
jgi:hypothetical protein